MNESWKTNLSGDEIIKKCLELERKYCQELWDIICENTDARLLLEIPEFNDNFEITKIENIKSCLPWGTGHVDAHVSIFEGKKDIYSILCSKFSSKDIAPIYSQHGWFSPPYDGAHISFNDKKIFVSIRKK